MTSLPTGKERLSPAQPTQLDAAGTGEPPPASSAATRPGRPPAAGIRPNAIAGAGAVRLAVILVNWNGADDTIECLESLLRTDRPVRVLVVDNGSEDDSVARIHAWASGATPYAPPDNVPGALTRPPLRKPVPLRELSDEEALVTPPGQELLTVIRSASNRGFAGGNNLGLRHALLDPSIGYFWCLNNDTVVEADAPRALLSRLDATPRVGMCGTQVRYYHRPGTIQQLNGSRFQLLTGQSSGIGTGLPVSAPFNPEQVARETDFVLGASLAVSRAFLETVGFMEEGYFLYFEEIDWAVRNRGRFAITFAHGAIVYHKEGGSIGSSGKKG